MNVQVIYDNGEIDYINADEAGRVFENGKLIGDIGELDEIEVQPRWVHAKTKYKSTKVKNATVAYIARFIATLQEQLWGLFTAWQLILQILTCRQFI